MFLIAMPCFADSSSKYINSGSTLNAAKPVLKLAQAKKVKKKKTKKKKRRGISSRDKTKIDFSNLDIDAGVKSGLELYIDNIKAKRDYNNIQIRTKWTKEMIQSALSLETGRGNR